MFLILKSGRTIFFKYIWLSKTKDRRCIHTMGHRETLDERCIDTMGYRKTRDGSCIITMWHQKTWDRHCIHTLGHRETLDERCIDTMGYRNTRDRHCINTMGHRKTRDGHCINTMGYRKTEDRNFRKRQKLNTALSAKRSAFWVCRKIKSNSIPHHTNPPHSNQHSRCQFSARPAWHSLTRAGVRYNPNSKP